MELPKPSIVLKCYCLVILHTKGLCQSMSYVIGHEFNINQYTLN